MKAEDFDVETPPDALPGSVSAAGGDHPLAELLLDMVQAATKVRVLIGEMDDEDFKSVRGRLKLLKAAISDLPESGRDRQRIGFKVRPKPKRRKR